MAFGGIELVDGLDVLLEATSTLDQPLTLATLNHLHQRLFAGGTNGLRAIRIGEVRDGAPMQVLSGAICRGACTLRRRPGTSSKSSWRSSWIGSPPSLCSWMGCGALGRHTSGFSLSTPTKTATAA